MTRVCILRACNVLLAFLLLGSFAMTTSAAAPPGDSFASKLELQTAIYDYMLWHDELDQPFHWTYRPKSWDRKPARPSAGRN